ncbi:hypothetical protein ACFX1S_023659 [Malus domestica]
MSLILTDFDLMAWTVEDLILSGSIRRFWSFEAAVSLMIAGRSVAKVLNNISIKPEGYDYDRVINWAVLVDSPNVSSFSFNAGSFDKFAVKNGSSPYELRKLWFKPSASVCKQASTNQQNSGENLCFEGVGDGSYKICQTQNFSCKTTARM